MYLIMKCEELRDGWECDADRTPITLTEDWEKWFANTMPDYQFEVFEFQNGKFTLVKDYETPIEEGMSLHYWTREQWYSTDMGKPTVVEKWEDVGRNDPIPEQVYRLAKDEYEDEEEMRRTLRCFGAMGWEDAEGNWWVYGRYADSKYANGI